MRSWLERPASRYRRVKPPRVRRGGLFSSGTGAWCPWTAAPRLWCCPRLTDCVAVTATATRHKNRAQARLLLLSPGGRLLRRKRGAIAPPFLRNARNLRVVAAGRPTADRSAAV